jgi:hypothetical protein
MDEGWSLIKMYKLNHNCRLCIDRGITCWDCKIVQDKEKGFSSHVKPKTVRNEEPLTKDKDTLISLLFDEIKAIKDVLINCVAKELRDIKLKQNNLEYQILELKSKDINQITKINTIIEKLSLDVENLINRKFLVLDSYKHNLEAKYEDLRSELDTRLNTMFENKSSSDIIPELNPCYTSSTIFSKDNSSVIISKMMNLMHNTKTGYKTLFNKLEHSQALKSSNIKQEVLDCVYNLSLGYSISESISNYEELNLRSGLKTLYNIVKNIIC